MIAAQGVREAGRHLEATYALEGTVQLAPGRARIGVQLVDTRSDRRVWSETLDRGFADLFALQDDVTAFVASALGEVVGEEQARLIADKPTAALNDYELAVLGMQHLHRINPEDNKVARGLFERVHARLPDSYFPTLLLCWTYAIELQQGWPSSRDDGLDYSLRLMRDVLRRHDRSAHAHRLMGRLLVVMGQHDQGLAHARQAFALNPYHSDMIMNFGMVLVWNGQLAEGVEKLERALEINPYAPTYYKSYLSFAYVLVGRHVDGLEILESVQGAIGPSRYARIAHLVALDRLEDARTEAGIVLQENPGIEIHKLLAAWPLKRAEDRAQWNEALRRADLPQ
jgi:adenylate cyclase